MLAWYKMAALSGLLLADTFSVVCFARYPDQSCARTIAGDHLEYTVSTGFKDCAVADGEIKSALSLLRVGCV